MPLWTGLMIKQGINVLDKSLSTESELRNKTRLDNNSVENRFGYIKKSIMLGNYKAVVPSEIVPKLYNLIKVSFIQSI